VPESQPSFLTVTPDGAAHPVFPGGLEIPVPQSTLPQDNTSVTWTDGPGGAKIAQAYGRRYIQTVGGVPGVRNELVLQSDSQPGDRASTVNLFSSVDQAARPAYTFQAELRTQADAAGSSVNIPGASAFAIAYDEYTGQNENPDIITDQGRSDFMQGPINYYTAWGRAYNWQNLNNTVPPGTILNDGYGVPLTCAVVPPHNCYFLATARLVWYSPDAAWSHIQWGIHLTPSGEAFGPNMNNGIWAGQSAGGLPWIATDTNMHNAVGQVGGSVTGFGCLYGGVQTNFDLAFYYSSNNNQQYYTGADFCQLSVYTFGRWHDSNNP
jgi:hypothetical protein